MCSPSSAIENEPSQRCSRGFQVASKRSGSPLSELMKRRLIIHFPFTLRSSVYSRPYSYRLGALPTPLFMMPVQITCAVATFPSTLMIGFVSRMPRRPR